MKSIMRLGNMVKLCSSAFLNAPLLAGYLGFLFGLLLQELPHEEVL